MNLLGYLQKLGQALMLPIAILPAAALLLRLGQPDLLDLPFIAEAGGAVIGQLPLLFCLGIAVGLSRDKAGAAALAGAVGYFVLIGVARAVNDDIDLSFFGGILAGIIAGHSYNRFHQVRLPEFLAFFGGTRLVPIITALIALLVALVVGLVWPFLLQGITGFSQTVATTGAVGQFFHGLLNRALVPFGLHHVVNATFWFDVGECLQVTYEVAGSIQNVCLDPAQVRTLMVGGAVPGVDGGSITQIATEVTRGDLYRFFAGDPTAGVFMAGFFPVVMFGLPAAALAMLLTASREKRTRVGGLLLSLAMTSLLTGITEPLEFAFMFLSPLLYGIHAVLTGLSLVLANLFGVLHGFGFSAGLFDLVLNWGMATRPWVLVGIGLVMGGGYFAAFYFAITLLNQKTPGRDSGGEPKRVVQDAPAPVDHAALARQYLAALGGRDNLTGIDACITRLRLTLKDRALVDEGRLKALGAKGVVKLGEHNLHVILGPLAEVLAAEIKALPPKA